MDFNIFIQTFFYAVNFTRNFADLYRARRTTNRSGRRRKAYPSTYAETVVRRGRHWPFRVIHKCRDTKLTTNPSFSDSFDETKVYASPRRVNRNRHDVANSQKARAAFSARVPLKTNGKMANGVLETNSGGLARPGRSAGASVAVTIMDRISVANVDENGGYSLGANSTEFEI